MIQTPNQENRLLTKSPFPTSRCKTSSKSWKGSFQRLSFNLKKVKTPLSALRKKLNRSDINWHKSVNKTKLMRIWYTIPYMRLTRLRRSRKASTIKKSQKRQSFERKLLKMEGFGRPLLNSGSRKNKSMN